MYHISIQHNYIDLTNSFVFSDSALPFFNTSFPLGTNMDSIVRSSVLFCICFLVDTAFAKENGYVDFEVANVSCKDPSSIKPPCSSVLDYKIPDGNNDSFIPDLSSIAGNILTLSNSTGGEQCSKVGTKYFCEAAYPFRCEDEYIEVDRTELLATCNESRKNCSRLNANIRDSLFNCSIIAANPDYHLKIPRKLNCEGFPVLKGDPYTCDANYKVCLIKTLSLRYMLRSISLV